MPMTARQPKPPKAKSVAWQKWKGVNRTDARTSLNREEFRWLENALPVGEGAAQILPGPGAAVATIAAGVVSLWGVTLNGSPVLIAVLQNGSLAQITVPGGVVTTFAGAGTVSSAAHCTIWQGSPVLIIDPTFGYMSWDGAVFAIIDATQTGVALAVFEGRVWIAKNRTIVYTAPNTFNDFTAGNGSGSTVLTDEAFPGNILALVSALEELWILGQSAIDAIANVTSAGTAPNVTTAFSITNIVTNLGTNAPASAIGYLRALALFAPFGGYALSGVTPQKLSGKLDGLLPQITLESDQDIIAAVAVVQSLLALLFLVPRYNGTEAAAGEPPLGLILGFVEGKWFFAVQRTALKWMTSVVVNGIAQAWGTDGSDIYQLFGAAETAPVTYKGVSKLFDFGKSTQAKAMVKVGVELQATYPVSPVITIDSSDGGSETITADFSNQVTWMNNAGSIVTWINNSAQAVTWVSQGTVLARANSSQFGHYLGWTIQGSDPPYRLQAVAFEVVPTREWSTP